VSLYIKCEASYVCSMVSYTLSRQVDELLEQALPSALYKEMLSEVAWRVYDTTDRGFRQLLNDRLEAEIAEAKGGWYSRRNVPGREHATL
jgi:hypothetical protein